MPGMTGTAGVTWRPLQMDTASTSRVWVDFDPSYKVCRSQSVRYDDDGKMTDLGGLLVGDSVAGARVDFMHFGNSAIKLDLIRVVEIEGVGVVVEVANVFLHRDVVFADDAEIGKGGELATADELAVLVGALIEGPAEFVARFEERDGEFPFVLLRIAHERLERRQARWSAADHAHPHSVVLSRVVVARKRSEK